MKNLNRFIPNFGLLFFFITLIKNISTSALSSLYLKKLKNLSAYLFIIFLLNSFTLNEFTKNIEDISYENNNKETFYEGPRIPENVSAILNFIEGKITFYVMLLGFVISFFILIYALKTSLKKYLIIASFFLFISLSILFLRVQVAIFYNVETVESF